jgi:hypothetical protein
MFRLIPVEIKKVFDNLKECAAAAEVVPYRLTPEQFLTP